MQKNVGFPIPARSGVMVGRAEILTPAFEKRLMEDLALEETGRPNPWHANRFFPAYANRVLQLRAAVERKPVEPAATATPVQRTN